MRLIITTSQVGGSGTGGQGGSCPPKNTKGGEGGDLTPIAHDGRLGKL